MSQPDRLSVTFAALADPTRRAILDRLTHGPATVGELAKPFEMSGPAVSKHLRVLERAGLIVQGREAQWRPCSLQASPLREVSEYASGFRRFWQARHDRLDDYLAELSQQPQAASTSADKSAGLPRPRRRTRGDSG